MKFLDKLERKYGRYAINNMIVYIIVLYVIGLIIDRINPLIYRQFLMLDVEKVLSGQIWRLLTFIIQPTGNTNPLFLFIELYLYYMIGNALENAWGSFRFNLYYFSGIIFNVLAVFVMYFITGHSYILGLTYINRSMFFAFASIFPSMQLLLFFIIPVKIKYLAIFYGAIYGLEIVQSIMSKQYHVGIGMFISLGNFLIYFLNSRNYKRYTPGEIKRRREFKREIKSPYGKVVNFNGKKANVMHKCTVCGRTEIDDDDLEFRFCSKCDGSHEYCSDHLFTHEHIKE